MTVKKLKPAFTTDDGRKFDSESEAAKHDALYVAHQEFQAAVQRFNRVIAKSQKTADGHPFEVGGWHTYYYITANVYTRPELSHVEYLTSQDIILDSDNDEVVIVKYEREGESRGYWATYKRREYPITKLYKDRQTANEALVGAVEVWLAERTEDAKELRRKVFDGR